jgi:hypothetical protein
MSGTSLDLNAIKEAMERRGYEGFEERLLAECEQAKARAQLVDVNFIAQQAINARLTRELEAARRALRYYAEPHTHTAADDTDWSGPGARARTVLFDIAAAPTPPASADEVKP